MVHNCLLTNSTRWEKSMDVLKKVPVREQDPIVRATNFEEVCFGYNLEEAKEEASRCLKCKNAKCITGCPVSIDIPGFIKEIEASDIEAASKVIAKYSALPAVCGRVCPQESQCEERCIRGIKGEPVSIGKLERFVADWSREHNIKPEVPTNKNGKKVAVIGSGPAGLTCAGDLAKLGYDVTIFEALHEPGGVLVYGIPEFRLPKETVVKTEIDNVKALGVKIETNVVIGKSTTIDELMDEEGFDAVFIGSGAGLPKFMGIPGENANGVFSANEYLTRSNLMKAFDANYDTPIAAGKKVAVVGGGNVAMDAARTAKRLGAEVYVVYRRSEDELPARVEEVHHAKEEGIIFKVLTNPTEILVDEKGWVKGMTCIEMELGEPDASGRRKPVEKKDSEFEIEVDTVIMSLGTSPNPLISSTTKGLETNKWRCIVADEANGKTTKEGVFAGGDAVTGAATVILAMGAGKAAAKGIDEYLRNK
jgi:glutamate synthase (NADPH) small chain